MSRIGKAFPGVKYRKRKTQEKTLDSGIVVVLEDRAETAGHDDPVFSQRRRRENEMKKKNQNRRRRKHGRVC